MSNTTAIALFHGTSDDLLMIAEANGVAVSKSETRAIVAASGTAIAQIGDAELLDDVATMLIGLFRMLGIQKEPDRIDGAQFMDDLKEYFDRMTLADVKHAFKTYILGDLDNYLPRDSKGRVVQHYQTFAPVFYIPVLKAYRTYQGITKKRVSDAVEVRLIEARANERDPVEDGVAVLEIIKARAIELAKGEDPAYLMSDTAEWALQWCRIIPKEIEITEEDIAKAKHDLTRGLDSSVGMAIRKIMKEGVMPDNVKRSARMKALRRLFRKGVTTLGPEEVARRFDNMITRYREHNKKPAPDAERTA